MATVSDLITRVRSLSGVQSPSILSDATIAEFLDEAQKTILHSADWPFLQHTDTAAVAEDTDVVIFTLPRVAQRLIDVFAVKQGQERPWQLFERGAPFISEDANGWSREFRWDAGSAGLTLFPAPNDAIDLTVRFVLVVPTLTSGSPDSDIVVPDEFVHAVSYLAASNILVREADESDRAQRFAEQSFAAVQQMRRVYMTSARGSFVVGGRRGYRRSARRAVWW
jgi:hypothetical protein